MQSIGSLFKLSALICGLMISSTFPTFASSDCRRTLKVATPQILTQETLKIMAWNMKNVIMHQGKFDRIGLKQMKRVEGSTGQPLAKPEWEIKAAQDIIAGQMPDFAVLTEVESVHALRYLLNADPRLKDVYHILLKEGNDARGIDIATIIKKDLGLRYKLDSYKDLNWTDRFQIGKTWKEETGPVFSRDLPATRMYRPGEETPFLILIGNHAKSKRDREGDPESRRWRTVQYQKASEIVEKYKQLYPEAIIIMAGDYNTDVIDGFEMNSLRSLMKSAFDLVPEDKKIPENKRVTHSYFSKGGKPGYSMIDDVRLAGNVKVLDARILDFLDKNGKPLGLPKTFKQRESQQPSDHNPLVVEIEN